MDLPSRNFKGIWIPKQIWLANDLTYLEKLLWAEINSLEDEQKGCTASNEYFCKFFKVKERIIQASLSNLKRKKHIYQASFDGRTRSLRCANAPQGCIKMHPSDAQNDTPTHIDIYNKGDISPLPSQKREKRKKILPSVKIERDQDVRTTDLEHKTLLEKFGSEEKVKEVYREYAIWKSERGFSGGNDFRTLKSWVLNEMAFKRSETPQKSIISKREAHLKDIERNKEIGAFLQTRAGNKRYVDAHPVHLIFSLPNTEFYRKYDYDMPTANFINEINETLKTMKAKFKINETGQIEEIDNTNT